ncbi:60S ribosomal protein l9, partial [Phtheirospermum japonicum]
GTGSRNKLNIISIQNQFILDLLRSHNRNPFKHINLPHLLLAKEVTYLNSRPVVSNGSVDRKVSVHEMHLVAVALGDAVDQIVDVAQRRPDGGGGFPAAEPGVDLQLEIEVQVIEITGKLAPGTFDFDHFGPHPDLHALGDIHGVGGENRLHFLALVCSVCAVRGILIIFIIK